MTTHTVTATSTPTPLRHVTFTDGRELDAGPAGHSVDVACDACPWNHTAVVESTDAAAIAAAADRMTAMHRSYLARAV